MEQPVISLIQKVILYETKARYYVVGSNAMETRFRVLKIDRTEPKELSIHDDKVEYSKAQIRNLLTMIKSGNTNRESKKTDSSLSKSVSAFGILGFVKFLEGYYMVLITKRRKVALIGPHIIYKIEDTSMLYIPNDIVRYSHPEEARYVKMFQSVDLSSNFYFSYSYDLTHTLQYNMASSSSLQMKTDNSGMVNHKDKSYGILSSPAYKFVWNSHLLRKCEHTIHHDWIMYITHGFIEQQNICVYGKPLYLTLIARRSNRFAGTRFLKRGSNCQGYVANEVETEQIVIDSSITFLERTKVSSFVQMRGSIPLYWSQDIAKMVPKPPITLDQRDPYCGAAGLHFNQLLNRYGAPTIILNLVKKREKRPHESILTGELTEAVSYLNQFLPVEHRIRYIGFDMAQVSKSKSKNVMVRLAEIARQCVKLTGLYVNMPKTVEETFWITEEYKGLQGLKTSHGSLQTGVVRTNCVDCLDRTNTAQFAIGKCALGYQLHILGVISSPDLKFDTDCLKMLEQLYEAQGDTIALQYGGSQLVHRIEGYRKKSPWTTHSKDIVHTLSRYYSNTFSDLEKQQATNIFLGLFSPVEGKLNIWELPTDYYLHNKDIIGVLGYLCKSYNQWWDDTVYRSLPLPYEQVKKPDDCHVTETQAHDEKVNHYEEFYKPCELTSLSELFSFSLTHSVRDIKPRSAKNDSPFVSRISTESKETGFAKYRQNNSRTYLFLSDSHEVNPNISGKDSTCSTTSTGSEESSDEDTDVDGDIDIPDSSYTTGDVPDIEDDSGPSGCVSFPPAGASYGFSLHKYLPNKHDTWTYERYVKLGEVCQTPVIEDKKSLTDVKKNKPIEIFPMSVFKFGSSYCVEPPPVNKQDQDIYHKYVMIGRHGPKEPSKKDMQFYTRYVINKYH